jgi:hypothetical protein
LGLINPVRQFAPDLYFGKPIPLVISIYAIYDARIVRRKFNAFLKKEDR